MNRSRRFATVATSMMLAVLTMGGTAAIGKEGSKSKESARTTSKSASPAKGSSASVPAKAFSKRGNEKIPRNAVLKDAYSNMKAFLPDKALASLARLIATCSKPTQSKLPAKQNAGATHASPGGTTHLSGGTPPRHRLVMARLLTLSGYAFQLDENLSAARNQYLIARTICPEDLIATAYLANCERELHHYDVEKALVQELENAPNKSISIYKSLARHAKLNNDYEQAMKLLKEAEALDTNKTDAGLQVLLGRTLIVQGVGEPAAKHFKLASERTENPYVGELCAADADFLLGDTNSFEHHLLAASKIYPYDPIWRIKLGNFYSGRNRDKEAFNLYCEAVNCKRFSSRAYLALATYFSGNKRWHNALNAVHHVQKMVPPSAYLIGAEAEIFEAKGETDKAVDLYKKALELNPQYSTAAEAMANLLVHKQPTEAMNIAEQCTHDTPNFWRPQIACAAVFVTAFQDQYKGRDVDFTILNEAAEVAKNGLALLPKPESSLNVFAKHQAARAHAIIGRQHYTKIEFDEVMKEAREFNRLKFLPDLPMMLKVVIVRPQRLKFDEKLGKNDAMTRAAIADMLLETGDMDGAVDEYHEAIDLMPNNTDLHAYLLNVLSQKGDWAEAAKENLIISQKLVNRAPGAIKDALGGNKKKAPEQK